MAEDLKEVILAIDPGLRESSEAIRQTKLESHGGFAKGVVLK